MAGLITVFLMGVFLGLLARPVLDAYVAWKVAKRYEAMDALVSTRDGVSA